MPIEEDGFRAQERMFVRKRGAFLKMPKSWPKKSKRKSNEDCKAKGTKATGTKSSEAFIVKTNSERNRVMT